jgi:hypothetical protein
MDGCAVEPEAPGAGRVSAGKISRRRAGFTDSSIDYRATGQASEERSRRSTLGSYRIRGEGSPRITLTLPAAGARIAPAATYNGRTQVVCRLSLARARYDAKSSFQPRACRNALAAGMDVFARDPCAVDRAAGD